jgi:hypothetical protein
VSIADSLTARLRLSFYGPPISSSSSPTVSFYLRVLDGRASFWFERLDAGQYLFLLSHAMTDLRALLSLD